jgi:hypothetical protein
MQGRNSRSAIANLDVGFPVFQMPINNISNDEQILSNRLSVKEEGTVLTLCSFSRNAI